MAVYNLAVMKESYARSNNNNGPSNFMEFMIEAERIDNKLFESIIEVDFAEAYNEAGVICLTEEEKAAAADAQKKGFFARVGELFSKAIEAIKKLVGRVVGFFEGIIKNDSKITENYAKYVNQSALSKCPIKGKYVSAQRFEEAKDLLFGLANGTQGEGGFDKWNPRHSEVEEQIKKNKEEVDAAKIDSIILDSGDKPLVSAMGADDFNLMVKTITAGEMNTRIKQFRMAEQHLLNAMEKAKKNAEATINNSEAKEDAVAGANVIYKNSVAMSSFATYTVNKLVSLAEQSVKVSRANFLKFAHWAKATSSGKDEANNTEAKANNESAADLEAKALLIEMANEDFVDKLMGRV